MIWKLAKKDLLLYLMTFKFAVGTIVCVLLTVALMPALVHDYQQRWQEYRAGVTADEAKDVLRLAGYKLPVATRLVAKG